MAKRCTNCGAPRQAGWPGCAYCGTAFGRGARRAIRALHLHFHAAAQVPRALWAPRRTPQSSIEWARPWLRLLVVSALVYAAVARWRRDPERARALVDKTRTCVVAAVRQIEQVFATAEPAPPSAQMKKGVVREKRARKPRVKLQSQNPQTCGDGREE